LILPSSPPEAISSAEPRGKEVSSFEVLASARKEMSGDTNEGKEISESIWMGSLVNEVIDFLEYILPGTRTWRSSQDEEFRDGPPWCWVELECEATVKGFGTAILFSLLLSPTMKSLSEKCRLHTWCLNSLRAVSASQGRPTPAHS